MNRILCVCFLLSLLTLCNSCKNSNINSKTLSNTPNEYKIDIVRIPQNDDYSCATTSLDMIISYYNKEDKPIDKEYIWKLSKTSKEQVKKYGNNIKGLDRIADLYKYKHKFQQGMSFDDLRLYISHNIPVIVFINYDEKHTHATLINGYDINKKIFYVLDPSVDETIMSESFLNTHWSAWLSNPKINSYRAGYIVFNK
jgi:ABC-type bacteriocin/lantibiotic exporter with double-glycine peptidase domain